MYPLQSLVGLPENFRDTRGVVVWGLGHAVMEGLPHYQPAEGVFLKVEESSGALNVGERCRVGPRLKLVQLAAGRPISQVADQFFVVPLAYPEEVDDLAVAVVENLNARWLFVEEHLGAARERLYVGGVLGQQGDDLVGKTVLAADVADGSNHWAGRLKIKEVFSLAIQAKGQCVFDQRRSKATVDIRPDARNYFTHLVAEAQGRMPECR